MSCVVSIGPNGATAFINKINNSDPFDFSF